MSTLRSLTAAGGPRSRVAALVLTGLALSLALTVGSSPAHAARGQAAARSQTRKAPPPFSPRARRALASKLERSLSKLGKRPTLRQLEAVGLKPVPERVATTFNKLGKGTRARAADAGWTYWFSYHYHGNVWADVWYEGPYPSFVAPYSAYSYYDVATEYELCDTTGSTCYPLSYGYYDYNYGQYDYTDVYTQVENVDINGTYFYYQPGGLFSFDSSGNPEYGFGPYTG